MSSLSHGDVSNIYPMTPATTRGLSHTDKPLTPASMIEPPLMSASGFTNLDIPKLRDMQKYIRQQLNLAIMSTFTLL